MSRRITRAGVLLGAAIVMTGCSTESELEPFSSDGCSLFLDASLISASDWCDCCFVHDVAYWKGGTADEREAADARLRDCVLERTGNATLATAMYEGVRFGGSPYFYNWYRWGYGWGYERKYQALSLAEQETADRLLTNYMEFETQDVCKRSAVEDPEC